MQPDRRFWRGKRVCVTGGTGFLGHHIVRQLQELNAHVTVLALRPPDSHPLLRCSQTRLIFGDLCDPDAVEQAVQGNEVVIHTAAMIAFSGPSLLRMRAVGVEGTRQVLEACRRTGAQMVHTSSIVAVGALGDGRPVTEESPFELERVPVEYIHAKRASEAVALEAAQTGQHVVVVNPSFLVGPGDIQRMSMGGYCCRFLKGRLPVTIGRGVNFADVRDVATGHLLAAEKGQSGRRYLLGGENRTMREFFRLLAEIANVRPRAILSLPSWLVAPVARVAEWTSRGKRKEPVLSLQMTQMHQYSWYCTCERARDELGYCPRPLTETLGDVYRWFQEGEGLNRRGFGRWWMRPAA